MVSNWFDVDRKGLRQIAERLIERRGYGILAAELYQNVMDTQARVCTFTVEKVSGKPQFYVKVQDDDPNGFADMTHAWTIFASSQKKADPTKAGRFNLGEKVVLAFCREASIVSTTGTVTFGEDGRHYFPRRKLLSGSYFEGVLNGTTEQMEQFIAYLRRIIVRPDLVLAVNGDELPQRKPIDSFQAKLTTEVADAEGALRKLVRNTTVDIFEPLEGEEPSLYELGIPVVETGDLWHYNVHQKVPLNVDRDNTTPAYLRALRTAVFNHRHRHVPLEAAASVWVNEAADSEDCEPAAAKTFQVLRYGSKSVALDPGNPEANAKAVAEGYLLIPPRGLTTGQRKNLYEAGSLKTSSQEFPEAGRNAYSDDPNAPSAEIVPRSEWTPGMRNIVEYTEGLGEMLLGFQPAVSIVKCNNKFRACYGKGGMFDYNLQRLGEAWFDRGPVEEVDSLIIHEFAHERESNHLSENYYRACTDLGAKLKRLALDSPAFFRRFEVKVS